MSHYGGESNLKSKRVYPKVKVRTEGQDDHHAAREHNWSSLLSLKDIQFLLLQESCFPVKKYRDVTPPPIARVPTSYIPSIVLPTIIVLPTESASEGSDKKSNSDEEDRPNIRASSVRRPRAVLSSPDNDAVIGNRNRVEALRPSALKNYDMVQSRHAQCKTAWNQAIDDENPLSSRKLKNTDNNSDLKGKKGSAIVTPRQKRNITSKPSSVRI